MTDQPPPAKLKVLLTGAAGKIGNAFWQDTTDRYAYRLAARADGDIPEPGPHEVVALDVADLEAFRAACRGMDAVVHLAADASPEADFYGSLLDANVKGVYNAFRAAADAGCRRVVFASSVHAVGGYPLDRQLTPEDPVRPGNMYGATKCFGEATAHAFATSEGLTSVCLRIGAYDANPGDRPIGHGTAAIYLSRRDLTQLLVRCLEAPLPDPAHGAVVLNAISDNRFKRLDIDRTRDLLGYAPQDDAFRLFGLDLDREF